ncbi:hypothetical protein [Peredibacter starrii]|uniref:Uncharacterized protein n=1 Tax=Peredibacter starrii TaxID=28202 RepID=A0AAX4HT55_9BACT|nr:hypothetical protein [Peredibacter starrii]WPU66565.1 hypothetical protein SOO65_07385 [Peredibacter starrii]
MNSIFLKMGMFLIIVTLLSFTVSCVKEEKKKSSSAPAGIAVKVKASKF